MWLLALLGSLLPALQIAPPDGGEGRVERRLALMGTWLEIEVTAADREQALVASERALDALRAVEERLSTWTDASELARLNAWPVGEPFPLSPELAGDLARVARLVQETDGAFDPAVGPLVRAWGLREGGRLPGATELSLARAASGFGAFRLDGRSATRLVSGASLEEGGFGKGLGLDAALRALRDAGARRAVLDLGGQVAVLGAGTAPATLGLAHPADRDRTIAVLSVPGGSVATSGNSERAIVVDGERRSHILDPRT